MNKLMKWVWAGIFGVLSLACLTALVWALVLVWTTGDLIILGPAVALAANGVFSGMRVWTVLDED